MEYILYPFDLIVDNDFAAAVVLVILLIVVLGTGGQPSNPRYKRYG